MLYNSGINKILDFDTCEDCLPVVSEVFRKVLDESRVIVNKETQDDAMNIILDKQ
jgi:hypothetical protein